MAPREEGGVICGHRPDLQARMSCLRWSVCCYLWKGMSVGQRFETMKDIDHSRQSAALGGLVASRRHVFEHHVSVCAVCFAGGGQRNGYVCVSHRVDTAIDDLQTGILYVYVWRVRAQPCLIGTSQRQQQEMRT